KQTGDWRNIGMLLACSTGITIQGLRCNNLHAYTASLERCHGVIVRDIVLNNKEHRIYNSVPQLVKNTDGINVRHSGSDILIENISGISSDDPVAVTMIRGVIPAG